MSSATEFLGGRGGQCRIWEETLQGFTVVYTLRFFRFWLQEGQHELCLVG